MSVGDRSAKDVTGASVVSSSLSMLRSVSTSPLQNVFGGFFAYRVRPSVVVYGFMFALSLVPAGLSVSSGASSHLSPVSTKAGS